MIRLVRDQAFKAMGMFIKRVEGFAASMVRHARNSADQPDTVMSDTQSQNLGPVTTTSQSNGTGQAGLVNSATGAAGALAGWAISSLSKQLATSEVHSSLSAQSSTLAPPTAPASATSSRNASPRISAEVTVPSVGKPQTVPGFGATRTPAIGSSRSAAGSGMKLGGAKASKKPNAAIADSVANEWEDGVEDAWGDDLIDVNADEDDWGESYSIIRFEPWIG